MKAGTRVCIQHTFQPTAPSELRKWPDWKKYNTAIGRCGKLLDDGRTGTWDVVRVRPAYTDVVVEVFMWQLERQRGRAHDGRTQAGTAGAIDEDTTPIASFDFDPYLEGKGPTFTLELYETGRFGDYGRQYVGYKLYRNDELLFEGDEYSPSPGTDIASEESAMGLLTFLTLRPGDTDEEYFEEYSARQMQWASTDEPETLELEASSQFGIEDY